MSELSIQALEAKMEDKLNEVEEKLDDHSERLVAINKNLVNLLTLLSGNELDRNDSGYIGKVKLLEERLIKLEKFKDRMIYIATGAGLALGYTVSDILTKLFTK